MGLPPDNPAQFGKQLLGCQARMVSNPSLYYDTARVVRFGYGLSYASVTNSAPSPGIDDRSRALPNRQSVIGFYI